MIAMTETKMLIKIVPISKDLHTPDSLPSPCLNALNINTKMWTQPQKSPFTLSQRKRLGILKKRFGVWPKTSKRFWLNASMFCYASIHAFIYIL